MPTYEFWVDPVAGSNSNAGTQAAPYATLYYANDANRKSNGDTVTINIVPSGSLQAADYIRILPQNNASSILVRSATPGVPFTHTNACDSFVVVFSQPTATLRIEDAQATCNRVEYFAGTNAAGNRTFSLTLAGSCIFTHGRTNAEEAFRLIVPPSPNNVGTLNIESGCQVNGWARLFLFESGSIGTLNVDGLIADCDHAQAGNSTVVANTISITNSFLTWDQTQNNILSLLSENGTVTFSNNTVTMNSTASYAVEIRATTSSGTGSSAIVAQNTITSNGPTYGLKLGNDITTSSTRAANNATVKQFTSCIVSGNNLIQENEDKGALGLFVGTDGTVVRGNYIRCGSLGNNTNVHNIYIWGDGIQFYENLCQGQLLAFGPNQVITDNLIIADRCILLGGTQGGVTASGGGNNYRIQNNVLAAFEDDCYSDYAFNGTYPTNLGTLVADVNNNQYVVLNTATGIARLTNTDLTATTMAQLRNVWQNSALSGAGIVWGDASNSDNDSHSQLEDGDGMSALVVQSASLSRAQLQSIKDSYRVVLKVGNSEILRVYKGSTELPKIAFWPNRKWLSV